MWLKASGQSEKRNNKRESRGCELSVLEGIKMNVLKWFGQRQRMGEELLVERVYRANLVGNRGRRRPQRTWRDEVKDFLLGRGLSKREGIMPARDKDARDEMVYGSEYIVGMSNLVFASVRGIHHPRYWGHGV